MLVKYVKFGEKRPFGVELEVNRAVTQIDLERAVRTADPKREVAVSNHYEQDFQNTYWHVKFDRSCGDVTNEGGWEIASYVAKNGYKDVINVGNVVESVQKAGAQVNRKCALHIHADVRDFAPNQMAILVAHWMKIERLVAEMVPSYRRDNKYCRFLNDRYPVSQTAEYTPEEFWHIVRPRNLEATGDRRSALNVVNYVKYGNDRKTAELRLPECLLDKREVKNWIRFFLHFVDTTYFRPFPKTVNPVKLTEALEIMGLHGEQPFPLLSKGLWETKVWVLERLVRHSTDKLLVRQASEWMALINPKVSKVPQSGLVEVAA